MGMGELTIRVMRNGELALLSVAAALGRVGPVFCLGNAVELALMGKGQVSQP